jgi:uncharacterized membrane protein
VAISLPSWFPSGRQWLSIGRHVVTFFAGLALGVTGITTYGVSFHFITGDQANTIISALKDLATSSQVIFSGLTTFVGALATLIGVFSALMAAWSSSQKSVAQATAAIPGTTVVTTPALADSTPEQSNIMSSAKVAIVPKTA